eukprot:391473-Prymnesium_polylepis.2
MTRGRIQAVLNRNPSLMAQPNPHASAFAVPWGIAASLASAADMDMALKRWGWSGMIAYFEVSSLSLRATSSAAARRAACAVVGCGDRPSLLYAPPAALAQLAACASAPSASCLCTSMGAPRARVQRGLALASGSIWGSVAHGLMHVEPSVEPGTSRSPPAVGDASASLMSRCC